jgi:hypothetical protein
VRTTRPCLARFARKLRTRKPCRGGSYAVAGRRPRRNGADSKTVDGLSVVRKFESLPLRSTSRNPAPEAGMRQLGGPGCGHRSGVNAGQPKPHSQRFRSPDGPPRATRSAGCDVVNPLLVSTAGSPAPVQRRRFSDVRPEGGNRTGETMIFSRGSGCKRRVDAEAHGEDLLANLANPVTVQSRAQASAGRGRRGCGR